MNGQKIARGLGWFSIGLGMAEVLVNKKVSKLVRMENRRGLIRMFGFREIGTGLGILMRRRPAPWMWGRVAGDAMDMVALGLGKKKGKASRSAWALGAVAGVTLLDILCGRQLTKGLR